MHQALHVPKQRCGRLCAEPSDTGKLHYILYNVLLLLFEVRHTFILLKLHLSFNILTLHTCKKL
ncbi:hypothetical protein E2C01_007137 [Portunus trituberculatus]|uniref:Uncharacterized protein n=1 Tax=Portunus trituberculatus TaxID=210409 RepID=A0A5B7CZN7_PORTR|nr:hypothetical protein [Portunus trituberculatus]